MVLKQVFSKENCDYCLSIEGSLVIVGIIFFASYFLLPLGSTLVYLAFRLVGFLFGFNDFGVNTTW